MCSPEARPGYPAVAPSPARVTASQAGGRCPGTAPRADGGAPRGGCTRGSTYPPCAGRRDSRDR